MRAELGAEFVGWTSRAREGESKGDLSTFPLKGRRTCALGATLGREEENGDTHAHETLCCVQLRSGSWVGGRGGAKGRLLLDQSVSRR